MDKDTEIFHHFLRTSSRPFLLTEFAEVFSLFSSFPPPTPSYPFLMLTFLPTFPLSLSFLSINITNLFFSGGKNELKSYSCDQTFIFLNRFLRIVNEAGPFSVICFIAPWRTPKIVVICYCTLTCCLISTCLFSVMAESVNYSIF